MTIPCIPPTSKVERLCSHGQMLLLREIPEKRSETAQGVPAGHTAGNHARRLRASHDHRTAQVPAAWHSIQIADAVSGAP